FDLVPGAGHLAQTFFVHQICDALDQRGAIDFERNLGDDDLYPAALDLLHTGFASHLHTATASLEILFHAADAADGATGRKVRSLHVLHQFFERDLGIVDLRTDSIDNLDQIVRRHVRRHADGDAGSAVDQQIWKGRRKYSRLGPCL